MLQFGFDSRKRILQARFTGRVNDEEFLTYYRLAAEYSVRFLPCAGITDFSGTNCLEVSTKVLLDAAFSAPALSNPNLPRFVVAPQPHIFGLARMFAAHGEQTRPNLHVVHAITEVWEMLGISEGNFEEIVVGSRQWISS